MKHIYILKPWVLLAFLALITITMVSCRTPELAAIPAVLFVACLTIISASKSLKWFIANIADRNRYHISDPDKDCGCYRLDRKTGSVQYIEPKTGAMSAKQEREIADDEERMYRENSL
jgi:hypothetical protein